MKSEKTILYLHKDLNNWERRVDRDYENISVCSVITVNDGYILPIKRLPSTADDPVICLGGGVQSMKGDFVAGHKRSVQGRLNNECLVTYKLSEDEKKNITYQNYSVVFGGMIINVFGHVFTETLARMWYVLRNTQSKDPIAFLLSDGKNAPDYFWIFMKLLGIEKERILIVNETPLWFRTIIVPDQALVLHEGYHSYLGNVYQTMTIRAVHMISELILKKYEDKRIYLTRSKFYKRSGESDCIHEEYFEHFYESRGYQVISPEVLPVTEQIALIYHAVEIVCTAGTLSHLLVFAKEKTKLTMLLRCNEAAALTPQFIINQMKNLDVRIVDVSYNYLPTKHWGGIFLLGPTVDFKEYLDEEGIAYTEDELQMDFEHTAWKYLHSWIRIYSENRVPYKTINQQDIFDVVNCMSDVILEKKLTREQMATPKKSCISETEFKEINASLEQLIPIAGKYSVLNHAYNCLWNAIAALYDIASISDSEKLKESMNRICLTYDVHIGKIGWVNYNGEYGIVGEKHSGNKIEAVRARSFTKDVKVSYGVYVGQEGWKHGEDGEIAGTTGKSSPIIGLFFKLDEESAKKYNIVYRAGMGDMLTKWHSNGEAADTFMWQGIETLEIYIESKESSLNGNLELLQKTVYDWKNEAESAKEVIPFLHDSIKMHSNQNKVLHEQIKSQNFSLNNLQKEIQVLSKEISDAHGIISELQNEIDTQCNHNKDLREQLEMLQHSFSWKITKPLRHIRYRMLQRKKKGL